jgi:hypothetical protein
MLQRSWDDNTNLVWVSWKWKQSRAYHVFFSTTQDKTKKLLWPIKQK